MEEKESMGGGERGREDRDEEGKGGENQSCKISSTMASGAI